MSSPSSQPYVSVSKTPRGNDQPSLTAQSSVQPLDLSSNLGTTIDTLTAVPLQGGQGNQGSNQAKPLNQPASSAAKELQSAKPNPGSNVQKSSDNPKPTAIDIAKPVTKLLN